MSVKTIVTNTEETNETEPEIASAQPAVENETLFESIASICTILVVWLFVMTFAFQNFEIPSGSMEQTLLIGDHVLVNRIGLAPSTGWARFMPYHEVRRGDIIVFFKPGEPNLFLVKRAIAIPGDRIHLRNGIVYLNGVAQNEPQAGMPTDDGDTQHAYYPYRDDFPALPPTAYDEVTPQWAHDLPRYIQGGDLVVPPGKIFAMGDNRTESLDGRFWGFVPRANIVGSPLFVYWSFRTPADQIDKQSAWEQLHFLEHVVIHFFDETRWKRTLHVIR